MEFALRQLHLLADGYDLRVCALDGFAGREPAGLCQGERGVTFRDRAFRFLDGGLCVVERGLRVGDGVRCLTDAARVVDLLRGSQLFLRAGQRSLVLLYRCLLESQLVLEHGQLGG